MKDMKGKDSELHSHTRPSRLRALSLWQPWASAMASGVKRNETRSWPTAYRGDLVVCSSKRRPSPEEVGEDETYEAAMALPYGYALCVVELYDCMPTDLFHGATPLRISRSEADLGDYTPGRFAWLTRRLRRLREPVPVVGRQGIFALTELESGEVVRLERPETPL
jgi:hypothetical protein